jgi:hypothetical protein
MCRTAIGTLALGIACAAWQLHADTLILRDGKTANGTFLGGTTRQIEFLLASGESLKVRVDGIKSLTFSAASPEVPSPPPPPPGGKSILIGAGLSFRVRTIDPIDVDAAQAGARFRGSLDDPIMSGGDVVVPRGADVLLVASRVQQGGRMKGSDLIELKVNSITVRGRAYPVVTSPAEVKSSGEGNKTARKILGGAGLGGIIGGIAGGGTGAAIGAVAGAAGGTALSASGQPHLKVPPETRLQFQLMADWKIR